MYKICFFANKLKLVETDGVMSNLSQTFAYDFEDRLTSWASNGTTLNQTQSWNLSLEGAWSSNTVNSVTETRTFNQAYETLTSNSNPMLHDRKGNLTQNKDGSVYVFDFDNQMKNSTNASSISASYTYDALGRRVSKSSGSKVTVYVNSGYQILTEYVSVSSAPFTENQSFVYATCIDEPIALINSNGVFYYHSNSQFSVGAMTDSLGNLCERYGYNAYGKPVTILDSILIDNPYYFTGRQLDTETNLFYFRARYYDAVLGQFISRDPIGYVDGMNLYKGYFSINSFDPFGLDSPLIRTIKREGVFNLLYGISRAVIVSGGNAIGQALTYVPFLNDSSSQIVRASTTAVIMGDPLFRYNFSSGFYAGVSGQLSFDVKRVGDTCYDIMYIGGGTGIGGHGEGGGPQIEIQISDPSTDNPSAITFGVHDNFGISGIDYSAEADISGEFGSQIELGINWGFEAELSADIIGFNFILRSYPCPDPEPKSIMEEVTSNEVNITIDPTPFKTIAFARFDISGGPCD